MPQLPLLPAFAPRHALMNASASAGPLLIGTGCKCGWIKSSDCCSTRNQMGDKRNHCDHQQQVDKTGCDVKCEETHGPKN
jgi:hypothetical protein